MVVIGTMVEGKKKPLYMDDGLYKQINDYVIPDVQRKDFDYVFVVDGEERMGKSVFAMQLAKVLDPNFNIDSICFTAPEFIKSITHAKKHSCVVFDEAFVGLSSRASLSEVNQLLVSLMMEMGQKNLFVIIVMPSFFMLEKYVVFHRTRGLFHVYMDHGRRGFWKFYSKYAIKRIHEKGKRFYEYTGANPSMFGRFSDTYVVNEMQYRERKAKSLKRKDRNTRAQKYKEQRDTLIYAIYKEMGKTQKEISILCHKYGFKLERSSIKDVVVAKTKEMLSES